MITTTTPDVPLAPRAFSHDGLISGTRADTYSVLVSGCEPDKARRHGWRRRRPRRTTAASATTAVAATVGAPTAAAASSIPRLRTNRRRLHLSRGRRRLFG